MKKLLLFLSIICVVGISFGLSDDLKNHMLVEYLFDGNLNDTSGNNRTGNTGQEGHPITFGRLNGTNFTYGTIGNLNGDIFNTDIGWSTESGADYSLSFGIKIDNEWYNSFREIFQNYTDSSSISTSRLHALNFQLYNYNGSHCAVSYLGLNPASCTRGVWHHFIINRSGGSLDIYMDGSKIYSGRPNKGLGRKIQFEMSSSISKVRAFDRALSTNEIRELGDEFFITKNMSIIPSTDMVLPKIVLSTAHNNSLSFLLNNLSSTQLPTSARYEYSWDGTNFSYLDPATLQTINPNNYSFSFDLGDRPYGLNTLTIRVKIGNLYSTLGTYTVSRIEPLPIITIDQPDTEVAVSKRISASSDKGVLEMSLSTSDTCPNSGARFEPYSAQTFTSESDNGKYVCYRVNYNGRIVYKISAKIEGITPENNPETEGLPESFSDYQSWRFSPNLRKDDSTYYMLQYATTSGGGSFVDINGDGLVDMLYSTYIYKFIYLNNGDLTFDLKYRCYQAPYSGSVGTISGYYGDCAAK